MNRFWEKTTPITESGCLIWMGATDGAWGYGVFRLSKKLVKAHRFAWELANGPIPKLLSVLHKCDIPACVNHNHLYLGTHKQNMADMVARKRSPNNHADKNPKAKLSWEEVNKIRAIYSNGGITQAELGKQFGISQVQIGHIVNLKHWPMPGSSCTAGRS